MITKIKINNYRRFTSFEIDPQPGLNILVGGNDAGKSTLLEAVALATCGRINGRWAQEELNPYWFNAEVVRQFFDDLEAGNKPTLPEISIEVYFDQNDEDTQRLRGMNNTEKRDCPGLKLRVMPDEDCSEEMEKYISSPDVPRIIPTELYKVEWEDFAGKQRTRQPFGVGHAFIDARTIRSSAGIDSRTRQMLKNFVTREEGIQIALQHRRSKFEITNGVLKGVNDRIQEEGDTLGVGLQMDQSASSSWDTAVTPQVGNIPFALIGQGQQVHAKVALAMTKDSHRARFVLIEEPENHLSHTSLMELVGKIETIAKDRQVFISTHSTYVLNRLGLGRLVLLHDGTPASISEDNLSADTVDYYRKQPGYDTLRLVLAKKVVVVEGPSDEMVFNLAYKATRGVEPRSDGVDVLKLGTRGKRALELAQALGRKVAVLRDNDGKDPAHWIKAADEYLKDGVREMFVGAVEHGTTLEPQFAWCNDEGVLRDLFNVPADDDLIEYMTSNKTDVAWQLASTDLQFKYPAYMTRAIEFINGD
jgi:predicted ATP-dependent endonuclease of OLD family